MGSRSGTRPSFVKARYAFAAVFVMLSPVSIAAGKGDVEVEFWKSVKDTKDPAELEAYIKAYPKGNFAALAQLRLSKIRGEAGKPLPQQAASPPPEAAADTSQARAFQSIAPQLDLFAAILDQVRKNYVDKPDDTQLIKNAILGVAALVPSVEDGNAYQIALARLREPDTKFYEMLDLFGSVVESARGGQSDSGDKALVASAVETMLKSLDVNSQYFAPRQATRCETGGSVGLVLRIDDGKLKVIAPMTGLPAARAGLQAADEITHVDGAPVAGLRLEEAVERLCGPLNSVVSLTIVRNGIAANVVANREPVRLPPLSYGLEGDVGVISIKSMQAENVAVLLGDVVGGLKKLGGANLKGFVIDLRDNQGGLLDQAVAIADAFLDKGVIMTARNRNPAAVQRSAAKLGDIAGGRPLAILINARSAAGAEVIAAALQDHKRAQIVGVKSAGAGTVQTAIPLGSIGTLRLTTGRIFRPSGKPLSEGISPDATVEADASGRDRQLEEAIGLVRAERHPA